MAPEARDCYIHNIKVISPLKRNSSTDTKMIQIDMRLIGTLSIKTCGVQLVGYLFNSAMYQ